jgi:hypothetical protein
MRISPECFIETIEVPKLISSISSAIEMGEISQEEGIKIQELVGTYGLELDDIISISKDLEYNRIYLNLDSEEFYIFKSEYDANTYASVVLRERGYRGYDLENYVDVKKIEEWLLNDIDEELLIEIPEQELNRMSDRDRAKVREDKKEYIRKYPLEKFKELIGGTDDINRFLREHDEFIDEASLYKEASEDRVFLISLDEIEIDLGDGYLAYQIY